MAEIVEMEELGKEPDPQKSTTTESTAAEEVVSLQDSNDEILEKTWEGFPVYREVEEERGGGKLQFLVDRFLPQPIRNSLKPPTNKNEWKRFLYVHLPIVHWVISYTPKYLIGDVIAGLTIGVAHIPMGIGFSLLAFLPPSYGLYSSYIPVLLYAIFGTSRHLSVGTFPVVALMTGQAVDTLTHSLCEGNATILMNDESDPCSLNACFTERINVAITLSLMVGIFLLLMSLLKLGVISLFLSDALISGYTAAAAFTILITQLAPLLGVSDSSVVPGLFVTPRRFFKIMASLFSWKVSVPAIVTSIISLIILIVFDLINRFLKKKVTKISIYIPGQLIVVILATGISYGANITDLPTIEDAGGILPAQCYTPKLPVGRLIGDVASEAFIIAVISFVINISQAKLMAQKNSYSIHPDQELFAYGIMNIGGSLFRSFPTAGALSRTVLQDLTGGKTQLVSIIASFIVLLVMLAIGFLFNSLPNAAVAAIVVMALKGLFLQVRDIRRYYYIHWPDMLVWLVVFLSTLIIGLDLGLGIGIFFSLFTIIVRTILPYSPHLGEANQWSYPIDTADNEYDENDFKVRSIPGCYIYQFNAPIYFANCNVFRSRLYIECGISTQSIGEEPKGCFEQCYDKFKTNSSDSFSPSRLQEKEFDNVCIVDSPDHDAKSTNDSDTKYQKTYDEPSVGRYQTVIIDCAPIGFVDSMGKAMIEKVVCELNSFNIQVLLASPSTPFCESLKNYGFFDRFSSRCLFPSVASAVLFAKGGHRVPKIDNAKPISKKLVGNFERILERSKRFGIVEKILTSTTRNNDKE
ncbi:PREDICTED: solute carrier family 26 member 10-like [Amphimedon queenslandica]|uniref:STAS domain-containing protein n=1 Tax=Amphimedon queenslandica TaxID=400682 RepID=A0AAN0J2Z7_AMPQE|nr:PREDICTED: solute carrier family 26 member 10-like [Amphimedon queenslandica]|eukprot:XP_019851375.1 PREDICTED: solute carrier family 26 member 10-like [Amphimedon queenslandica]